MALTIACDTEEQISLEEYLDFVRRELDASDLDSLAATAGKLKALANNRTFILDKMNSELSELQGFQAVNPYSAQTLMLGWGDDWFVRANIWEPVAKAAETREWQDRLYSYRLPHDHNFSFMTVGYWGSGYATQIFEYEPESVKGHAGEPVDLRFLERTTLPRGKVMLYRACRDVHNQEHPEEFSISLNLMVSGPALYSSSQYMFDLDNKRIEKVLPNSMSGRLFACRMARYFGDCETASLLDRLATTHVSSAVRISSTQSLAALQPSVAQKVWERAMDMPDDLVRTTAVVELRKLAQQ